MNPTGPNFPPNLPQQMAGIRQDIRKLKSRLIASPDWNSLLPIGNLISQGSPYGDLEYYLTQDGWVVFQGVGKTTVAIAAGGTIFTLPTDVPVPPTRKMFTVYSTAGPVRVDFDTTGAVIAVSALPTVGSYISFENIRYRW